MSKNIPASHFILGIYQIVGGLLGIGVVLWLIKINTTSFSAMQYVLLSLATALYIYSIFCGVLLIKANSKGLNQSQINQCLQLVSIFIFGCSYQYYSGGYLSAGFDMTHSFRFIWKAGLSTFQMNFLNQNESVRVSLNFVALGLILYIEKLMRKEKALLHLGNINNQPI
jgi:hypothetical protein